MGTACCDPQTADLRVRRTDRASAAVASTRSAAPTSPRRSVFAIYRVETAFAGWSAVRREAACAGLYALAADLLGHPGARARRAGRSSSRSTAARLRELRARGPGRQRMPLRRLGQLRPLRHDDAALPQALPRPVARDLVHRGRHEPHDRGAQDRDRRSPWSPRGRGGREPRCFARLGEGRLPGLAQARARSLAATAPTARAHAGSTTLAPGSPSDGCLQEDRRP